MQMANLDAIEVGSCSCPCSICGRRRCDVVRVGVCVGDGFCVVCSCLCFLTFCFGTRSEAKRVRVRKASFGCDFGVAGLLRFRYRS